MADDTLGRSLIRRRFSCLAILPYVCGESPQGLRGAYYVEGRVTCVLSDRFHQKRTALAVIPQQQSQKSACSRDRRIARQAHRTSEKSREMTVSAA